MGNGQKFGRIPVHELNFGGRYKWTVNESVLIFWQPRRSRPRPPPRTLCKFPTRRRLPTFAFVSGGQRQTKATFLVVQTLEQASEMSAHSLYSDVTQLNLPSASSSTKYIISMELTNVAALSDYGRSKMKEKGGDGGRRRGGGQ